MKKETNLFDMIGSSPAASNRKSIPEITRVSLKDIAIIGMAVRFPLTDDIEQFWYNLRNGVDCIRRIPESRKKDAEDYFHFIKKESAKADNNYEEAAYLDEIDKFDYHFFGLSPKEASLMDPNQRLFLQTAWTAMEDAGYGGERLVGTRTGVYVGFGGESEYKKLVADVEPSSLSLAVTGNLPPIIASRLSYLLDLKGPNMLVNTVCSSSLLAVHLACRGIRNRECDFAIAGGVQTYVLPIRQTRVGIESSDFKTKTFDHGSDGTGSGEGVAAVLLKPLHKALKDRDHVYAVIKGGAVNQDGRSIGISAPNPAAQEDVICRAWKDADIDPETISYIEAHGTGTKLGDPIEIEGITRAFARFTQRKQFCAIGSVKSNMGHLDNSAGIAGLIKAAMALKNKEIPPTLHFNRPNRQIPFHRSPVYVSDTLTSWETNGFPRRCGVSSFSFSGTNCHLILEEAPEPGDKEEPIEKNPGILTLSAKTLEGLKTLVKEYKRLNKQKGIHLNDLCFTANTGRGHYSHRLALVLRDERDFTGKIANLDIDHWQDNHNGIYYGVHQTAPPGKEITGGENGEITREQRSAISKTANEKLRSLINDRNNETLLHQVCELYIKGAEIDWDEWYCSPKPGRMSVPTYPFQLSRCWLRIPALADEDGYYYTTGWKQEELPERPAGTRQDKGIILILKDRKGIGEQIAARFRGQGKSVVVGEDYEKILSNPGMEKIRQVIHLQSILGDEESSSPEELEKQLKRGVYSLFYLTKVLLARNMANVDMVLVSDYAHDVTRNEPLIHPGNTALFGLGKVVNVENVNLKCRTVDIDSQTPVDCISREINAGYTQYKVAYRSGSRYIEEVQALDITNVPGKDVTIKQEGVYIITGGTGGLGLEIAGYFASRNKVNLALIHRTPIPARTAWDQVMESEKYPELAHKLSRIREIEKKGTRVLCCRADAANELEMKNAVDLIRNKFGRINGIVHCAGVGSGRQGKRLEQDSEDIFKEVMAPKVQGTWLLDRLTRDHPPDFFVVFSSPITLMGGIGSGSYTAANTYLDAFSFYRNKKGRRTIAMSWAPWEKTLQKINTTIETNKHLFEVLSTHEIISAFDRMLDKDIPLVIIGKLNEKSDIFYLGDYLPFGLSGAITRKIKPLGETVEYEKGESGGRGQEITVQLTGRKNNRYSREERQVAQIYGQFLGYKELNIYDNFYELGGDSIIAIKIIQAINKQKEIKIEAADLLKHPTIEDFARFLQEREWENSREFFEFSFIPLTEEKIYDEVSSAQKRVFLLHQQEGGGTGWNITYVMKVEGPLDKERLQGVFQQLIQRHETLRTSFHIIGGNLVQKVNPNPDFKINDREFPYDPSTAPGRENGLQQWVNENINQWIKPFHLDKVPLLRVEIFKLNPHEHILFFDVHHIISDDTSIEILVSEMLLLYSGKPLPGLRVRYKDFSAWQKGPMNREKLKKQEEYWLNRFKGEIPVLHLPSDYQRPTAPNYNGEVAYFTLNRQITGKLNALAAQTETTLYWVLMAVYNILLSKYSGQEDIVVGVLVNGRTHPDLENIVGMFVNVLPLRNFPQRDQTFMEFLQEVKRNLLEAYANQDYPFDELVERLKIKKSSSRNPLFDVSFQAHPTAIRPIEISEEVRFIPIPFSRRKAKHDLLLEFYELQGEVKLEWLYSTELFTNQTIDRMINGFTGIIDEVMVNPHVILKDIKIITGDQRKVLLDDFNEKL